MLGLASQQWFFIQNAFRNKNRPRIDGKNGTDRKSLRLRFGTLNILTLTNKIEELIDVMKDRRLDVLGLSETKWRGWGEKELRDGYKLFWSGNRRGRNGVAFIGNKEIKERIEEVKYISDRLISMTIKMKTEKCVIMQVYAPQAGCTDQEKEDFEVELEEQVDNVNILMGDLNAKVGRDRRGYEEVLGAFGYGPRNREGERLLDLCARSGLAIGNSRFQKRESHVVTRYSWDGNQKSVIDYVIVDKVWGEKLIDVKVVPSVNMEGDHRLLVGTFKWFRSSKKLKGETTFTRIKVWKLQQKEELEKFQMMVRKKLPKNEIGTVEAEWENFKKVLVGSAEEVCGRTRGKKKEKTTDWWNERTIEAVREKNIAFRKWWKSRKQEDKQSYNEKRRVCSKIIKEEKRKTWEQFTNKLEADMESNKKMFYKMMKNKKRSTESAKHMEDENGRLVENGEDIRNLWRDYFKDLLNSGLRRDESEELRNDNKLVELEEMTWNEIENAVKGMKNNKSAGPDEVTVDMIKALGPVGLHWLKRLFMCVLKEGRTPEEWGRGDIVTLFKKGSRKRCGNYRGITLMCQVAKIFEKVILNRIGNYIENQVSEEQHGFRRNRSTVDLIFAVRQLIEKHWEFDQKIICVFIDIEKAYDSVKRSAIWDSLRCIGLEEKYIEWIKELYRIHKCRVKTVAGYTRWFDIGRGLKQGSILSPILFNVIMEIMWREIKNTGGNVGTMMFADDIMLWGRSEGELQRQLDKWTEVMRGRGLRISKEKSEVMVIGRDGELERPLKVEGKPLKLVEKFTYLGTVISNDGRMAQEITTRLGKGAGFYQSIRHLLWDKDIPKKAKVTMYKTYYTPIVTYGAEVWNITEREWSRVQAGEMKFIRGIKGKTRLDRMRNEELRRGIVEESLRERVEKSRLRWFGHVKRMEDVRIPRRMSELQMNGRRPRGRPRGRWIDEVKRDVEARGVQWGYVEEEELWKDRRRWRGLVNTQTRR